MKKSTSCIVTVSYTHLDVYKRQDLVVVPPHYEEYLKYSKLAKAIYCDYTNQVEPYGMDAVSYTHLDVYKRQAHTNAPVCQHTKYLITLMRRVIAILTAKQYS